MKNAPAATQTYSEAEFQSDLDMIQFWVKAIRQVVEFQKACGPAFGTRGGDPGSSGVAPGSSDETPGPSGVNPGSSDEALEPSGVAQKPGTVGPQPPAEPLR